MGVNKVNLNTKSKLDHIDVPFEMKFFDEDDNDKFFIFEGFASTFGNLDLVDDIVLPGAFEESIEKQLPVILWQHSSFEPIGITVKAEENEKGLFIRGHLPKDDSFVTGRVAPQLRIRSIKAMSIGFRVLDQEPDLEDPRIRKIKKVDLMEISLVTFPANPQAVITDVKALEDVFDKMLDSVSEEDKPKVLKSIEQYQALLDEKKITVEDVKNIIDRRQFEKVLREAGFSKSAAEKAASNKFNKSLRSEPVDDEVELTNALADINSNLEQKNAASELSKISQKVNSHGISR